MPQLLPDESRPAEPKAAERVDVEHEQGQRERHRDGLRAEGRREGREGCHEPSAREGARPCRALKVGEQRDEIEEAAEQVSPLRDPRDRFHAKGVQRPQQSGGGGAQGDGHAAFRPGAPVIVALALQVPVRSGRDRGGHQQSAGDEEEERGVRRVEKEIAQMIAPRVHPPERVVEPERQPRDRDVVPHPRRGEHPPQLAQAEAAVARVPQEVPVVVPVQECSVEGGQERDERQDADEKREQRPRQAGHRPSSAAYAGASVRSVAASRSASGIRPASR